jgi:hypothetical protein
MIMPKPFTPIDFLPSNVCSVTGRRFSFTSKIDYVQIQILDQDVKNGKTNSYTYYSCSSIPRVGDEVNMYHVSGKVRSVCWTSPNKVTINIS